MVHVKNYEIMCKFVEVMPIISGRSTCIVARCYSDNATLGWFEPPVDSV